MSKIFRLLTASCIFLLLNSAMEAQEVTVTGKVTGSNNEALQGVNINVKKSSRSVFSDASGNFNIRVAKGNVLVVTSVGYLKREITVGDNPVINVALSTDTRNL